MQFVKLVILFLLFFFTLPSFVVAHGPGEDPYFLINNRYTQYYPVPLTIQSFILPQDIAPELYVVNEEIEFRINPERLPFPPELVKDMTFLWDFGDGNDATGLENTHTYSEIGSHVLTLSIQLSGDTPQLLQSTMIHIVPNRTYTLPQAVIAVNGKVIKDPLIDVYDVNLHEKIAFDGSKSSATTAIASYTWDFGDNTKSEDGKTEHMYKREKPRMPIVFPVLRIVTEDGFIADTFVQLNNTDGENTVGTIDETIQEKSISMFLYPLILFIATLAILLLFTKNRKKK